MISGKDYKGIAARQAKIWKEVNNQLRDSVHEEMEAIDLYKRRAEYARKNGYDDLAQLYDHTREEEEHHSKKLLEASHKVKIRGSDG